jgi:hypothetical protein
MTILPNSARELVNSGRLAHVVTLNEDGSPQVSCVWIATDGDQLVIMHTAEHVMVRNHRRDPRVAVSIESEERSKGGHHPPLQLHLVSRVVNFDLVVRLGRAYSACARNRVDR